MARDGRRLRRGVHVQLREIPGLTGQIVTDLSGLTPPMMEVRWDGALSGCGVVEVTRLERVVFDTATQEWRTPPCDHDWRQVEMDAQECAQCGATRHAYSGWQPF